MLKALKWAYDLGVRQERIRISAHLQGLDASMRIENDTILNIMRDPGKPGKTRKLRIEFDLAVNNRVGQIINQIMQPKEQYVSGASLMFPNDKHKGEMK